MSSNNIIKPIKGFTPTLLNWFKDNKRNLPWRETSDAYKIWLSEIILQQTRVAQGLPYYNKFIDRYPSVYELAQAKQQEVLVLWQGLGYYSRARNLHECANQVVREHKGSFPQSISQLKKLKGIGDYTAAAIGSIAFNIPEPVIDGNVIRLITRLYGLTEPTDSASLKEKIKNLLQGIDKNNARSFNEGLMEFGALQCVPKNPDCENCPFSNRCFAFNKNFIDELPVKKKKVKKQNLYIDYFLINQKNKLVIQPTSSGIYKNMYELPNVCSTKKLSDVNIRQLISERFKTAKLNQINEYEKHLLTHKTIFFRFWKVNHTIDEESLQSININEIGSYPFPVFIQKFLQRMA